MQTTRLAYVRYLNTKPLVEGLQALRGLEMIAAAPSHIADMVRSGRADIGLASVVDAVGSGEPLAFLPVGMIGCDGPTMTVRLYATRPLDQLTVLHADTESHTSIVLCRLLLRKMFGISPRIEPFDARERMSDRGPEEWPDAMLIIGDKVVTDSPPAVRYPHQLDLGEAWHRLTGLPFVYATWVCRAADSDTPGIQHAASLLDRQMRHNLTRLDWLLETRSVEHHWPADLARTYVVDLLRYRFGPREREGLEQFLAEAAAEGFLPSSPVRWAPIREAVIAG